MFIRVKRKKTTYFLHCDPSESVLETKQKLQALCDVHVDKQRLILVEPETILDEAKSLEEQQVGCDALVALTYKIQGMNEETNEETNSWEEINIEKPIDPKAYLRKDHNEGNNTNL
ncbi:unnamed protein product [Sphagnum troendelagicum]|uniref:Ubiquitin-like domain-containing protein n=1 Tax=Sphagnum troendelagicum TaxID=128251 RepID=A0ABP0T9R6_9BRYO